MSDYVIWLDSEQAQIFALKTSGIDKVQVKKTVHDHHTQHKKDGHGDQDETRMYREISERLLKSGKILIVGPGQAKNRFKSFLEEHSANDIAKNVVGVETCDHPTENQILAIARKFYVNYHLFNVPTTPK